MVHVDAFCYCLPMRQYITTAIDYPNAPPHMGHVLEKVLADVYARWCRLKEDEVRFQIGTDEHGIKIQRTAEEEGVDPKDLVDRNVPLFEDLYQRLQISSDVFIRTSDQKVHWPTVVALWKRLQKKGMLEKKSYTGLYCSGCERFMTARDLEDGLCPNHKKAPEEVTEENWFFLLRKESDWLKKTLSDTYKIVPDFRANETLSLIDQGLEDVSFSRPKSSLAWGIPVPGDEEQTMYVWCDALTNYISGLGYFTEAEDRLFWDKPAEVTHVIGKDIARFHALYWPAMLKHADVRIPDRLLIHGFLTSEGQKMSKSLGNVVVPDEVIEKYGVDALRFYLSHEVPVGRDGDFSWKRFGELYNAKLRNDLGNLLNRVLVLLKNDGGSVIDPTSIEGKDSAEHEWKEYEKAMNNFELHIGVQTAMRMVSECNNYIDLNAPWKKEEKERGEILSFLAERLRFIALMLLPFIPGTSKRIFTQLNLTVPVQCMDKAVWGAEGSWTVGSPEILFEPVE
jgi:methionyl-tRNA synthetase